MAQYGRFHLWCSLIGFAFFPRNAFKRSEYRIAPAGVSPRRSDLLKGAEEAGFEVPPTTDNRPGCDTIGKK